MNDGQAQVTLVSCNGTRHSVPLQDALRCKTLAQFFEDDHATVDEIPLPAVCSEHLVMILAWLQKDAQAVQNAIETWPAHRLFPLMNAVDYLNVADLLVEMCRGLADRIRGKQAQEIAKELGILDDGPLHPAERARRANVRAQHAAAFEL